MDDFISREAALKFRLTAALRPKELTAAQAVADAIAAYIQTIPAADVVEVRHAHWILHISEIYPADSTMECSACNEEQLIGTSDSYCPHCGAKMDGSDKNA